MILASSTPPFLCFTRLGDSLRAWPVLDPSWPQDQSSKDLNVAFWYVFGNMVRRRRSELVVFSCLQTHAKSTENRPVWWNAWMLIVPVQTRWFRGIFWILGDFRIFRQVVSNWDIQQVVTRWYCPSVEMAGKFLLLVLVFLNKKI